MNINNATYPNIGLIKVKPRPDGKYLLELHPTLGSLLPVIVHDKREDAHIVEVVVSAAELERIRSVAPHLLAQPVKAESSTGMAKRPQR
jgi:hypothetical protein